MTCRVGHAAVEHSASLHQYRHPCLLCYPAAGSTLVLTADAEGAEPPVRYRWHHARMGVLSTRMNVEVAPMPLTDLSAYSCDVTSAIGQHPPPLLYAKAARNGRSSMPSSPRSLVTGGGSGAAADVSDIDFPIDVERT